MLDDHDFPTQLPDDVGGNALRWTAGVIGLTAAALALLNAGAIAAWSDDLAPGPRTTTIVAAAEAWQDRMAQAGLGSPHAGLHRAWTRLEEARWSPQTRAQTAAVKRSTRPI